MPGFHQYAGIPWRTAPQAFSVGQKLREKKSVTQELAAASSVPPAFRKQVEQCCIFPHSPQVWRCRRRAVGIAVWCAALRPVYSDATQLNSTRRFVAINGHLRYIMTETTRYADVAALLQTILDWKQHKIDRFGFRAFYPALEDVRRAMCSGTHVFLKVY